MKIMSLGNGGDSVNNSPPFLRDIIFISRKHRYSLCISGIFTDLVNNDVEKEGVAESYHTGRQWVS